MPRGLIPLFFLIPLLLHAEPVKWVFTDYAPANYIDGKGEYAGFLYDITKEAFENRLHIPLIISLYPWARCQQLVQQGDYDMFLTIPTPDREVYAEPVPTPVWIKKRLIFTYGGHGRREEMDSITGLDQIRQKGFTVISYIGNQWVNGNVESRGIPVEYARSVDGMYRMLAAKRGDLIIEEPSIVRANLETLGLSDTIEETGGVAEESSFHLLMGRKSPFVGLIDDLDLVLREMWQDGTIQAILDRYGA